jgi:Fur family ferric uptake transcriptional regulator
MNLKEILKNAWKSYTEEREVIYWIIKKLHHFDYSDVQFFLEKNNIKIWRASIFRTLNLFVEVGILENICNKNWVIIYEYLDENNHHEHMKCRNCWIIIEFDDSKIHKYLEEIAESNNFKLLKHSINLEWLCKDCNK